MYVKSSGPLHNSPILAWVADGFPLYGPYGYSDPTNAKNAIRRMVSGFVPRNSQFGTDDLAAAGRNTIPQWAVRAYNVSSNQTGPSVSTTYPHGHYLEDNDYLGEHDYAQGVDFDLNQYNARWCGAPEFPNGTWAYFCTLTASNTPAFPYAIGCQFLGATIPSDTHYEGKADACLDALKRCDFCYVHVEAPDEAGHKGNVELKVKTTEDLDARLIGQVLAGVDLSQGVVAVLPDHPTPVEKRVHVSGAVPFAVRDPRQAPDKVERYDEQSCAEGSFGTIDGDQSIRAVFQK